MEIENSKIIKDNNIKIDANEHISDTRDVIIKIDVNTAAELRLITKCGGSLIINKNVLFGRNVPINTSEYKPNMLININD